MRSFLTPLSRFICVLFLITTMNAANAAVSAMSDLSVSVDSLAISDDDSETAVTSDKVMHLLCQTKAQLIMTLFIAMRVSYTSEDFEPSSRFPLEVLIDSIISFDRSVFNASISSVLETLSEALMVINGMLAPLSAQQGLMCEEIVTYEKFHEAVATGAVQKDCKPSFAEYKCLLSLNKKLLLSVLDFFKWYPLPPEEFMQSLGLGGTKQEIMLRYIRVSGDNRHHVSTYLWYTAIIAFSWVYDLFRKNDAFYRSTKFKFIKSAMGWLMRDARAFGPHDIYDHIYADVEADLKASMDEMAWLFVDDLCCTFCSGC